MKWLSVFVLAAALASAAVEGTVQNRTSSQPQSNAVVTLVELGGGMNTLGSVRTDATGKFTIPADLKPATPYLIQALHQGVTYNQMLKPGAQSSGLRIEVYDASAKAADAKVTQHMILLEPSASELLVNEAVIFTNTGNVTYQDADGTLKIWVPSAVNTPVRLRITAPQGMRSLAKPKKASSRTSIWSVIPSSLARPASTSSTECRHRTRRIREPHPAWRRAGSNHRSKRRKARERRVDRSWPRASHSSHRVRTKRTQYALNVVGTGSLRDSSAESAFAAAAPTEADTPAIEAVKPRVYGRMPLILGLTFAMLAIGFVMLYRTA